MVEIKMKCFKMIKMQYFDEHKTGLFFQLLNIFKIFTFCANWGLFSISQIFMGQEAGFPPNSGAQLGQITLRHCFAWSAAVCTLTTRIIQSTVVQCAS